MSENINIIFKNRDIIVINKPKGMPSQSDPSGDLDAMSAVMAHLKAAGERDSLWLVHRLDRTVGGLLVFARNKKSAGELSVLVAGGGMIKRYLAVCHGVAQEGEYTDFLYKDASVSKAYVVKNLRRGAKEARLKLSRLGEREDKSLVSVKLETGRFHQIRAQLSSRGNSLVGDKKYGSRDALRSTPALFASELSFTLLSKKYSFFAKPDVSEYPWSIFADVIENNGERKDANG